MTIDLKYEPDVRSGDTAVMIHPTVTVTGLTPAANYTIMRYVGTENLPASPPFTDANCERAVTADSTGRATWADGPPFMSDQAVYHLTVPGSSRSATRRG